jgi:hypothetical protein
MSNNDQLVNVKSKVIKKVHGVVIANGQVLKAVVGRSGVARPLSYPYVELDPNEYEFAISQSDFDKLLNQEA